MCRSTSARSSSTGGNREREIVQNVLREKFGHDRPLAVLRDLFSSFPLLVPPIIFFFFIGIDGDSRVRLRVEECLAGLLSDDHARKTLSLLFALLPRYRNDFVLRFCNCSIFIKKSIVYKYFLLTR